MGKAPHTNNKKREIIFIAFLLLMLSLALWGSAFALGVNVGLLPGTYQSVGLKQIKGENTWAASFDLFNGYINRDLVISKDEPHTLYITLATEEGGLSFTIFKDKIQKKSVHMLDQILILDLSAFPPGEYRMVVSGSHARHGHFAAQWGE